MSDSQSSGKRPHCLFREIDGLCEEIDKAVPNSVQESGMSEIQGVLKDQDDRDRAKRKNDYARLLFAASWMWKSSHLNPHVIEHL
jgi:hypothetical protein